MAKRKDRVTKDQLRDLCKARRQAIQCLEKFPGTPESADILAQRIAKIAIDLANEIADKLDIFFGGITPERATKPSSDAK